ncbi:LuxR C-terminal-related transcriptional regulator [Falsiroseomonas sp. E2-1-a4]|uniref:LuxR C-terminal-related transcriptional regulator n=1 Tax=Falsiroseomonas sp. E2-1-a4 TaxID=3239299 RepID=UPI003F34FABF
MVHATVGHQTAHECSASVRAALLRNVPQSRTRVAVCSHTRLLREGVALALAQGGLIDVSGTVDPADLPTVIESLAPDVLLLDASVDASLDLPSILLKVMPELRIIVFAVANEQVDVVRWAESGVSGYVGREGGIAELTAAVDGAMRGEAFCSPKLAALLFARIAQLSYRTTPSAPLSGLTPREREILLLVDQGLSNKQIARRLEIGHPTVKNHVHHILEKMNAQGRGEAAARMRRSAASDTIAPAP